MSALHATGAAARELAAINTELASLDAARRVRWTLEHLPGTHALTSSFGAQAAVSLHLLATQRPDIPVILVDTGYLFPETYRFADQLRERLGLNLHVYRAALSPAWQEARHGKTWEHGVEGLKRYHQVNKIEPLQRALRELKVGTWFTGIRRQQSQSRAAIDFVELREGRYKVHPLADWSDRDIWQYLTRHCLPYHPLWEQGYVSIGDVHSTRPLDAGMREEDTRFQGLKRECGIHGLEG